MAKMSGINTFSEVLRRAISDFEEHGFDSEERLEHWRSELERAAQGHTVITAEHLKRTLTAIYNKDVTQGGLLRSHGISKWKLERIAPRLRNELDRKIMAASSLIKLNREEMIAKTLRRFSGWATSIPVGGSEAIEKRETNDGIKKALKALPFEERRVMIDQAAKFKASLSNIVAVDGGAIAGVWRSHFRAAGYNARPDHVARDGKIYVIRDNWAMEKGLMKLGGREYTDQITMPAEEVFCFPGDSEVPYAHFIEKAYRRWYSGKLTEIVTASGKTIRATPNHPILTDFGWKAIGLLEEGDNVIEISNKLIQPFECNKNDRISTIAEIYGSLQEHGFMDSTSIGSKDFHGDGIKGNVNIVFAAWPLTINSISAKSKRICKLFFTKPNLPASKSHFKMAFVRILGASNSIMCGLGDLLAILRRSIGHAQSIGFLAGANNSPGIENANLDGLTANSIFGSDRLDGLPIGMKLCKSKVNIVRQVEFAGHVYNLQTKYHWYSVNAIITHNCQCRYKYLFNLRDLPDEMLTDEGRKFLKR